MVEIDTVLVQRLVAAQFPQWADLAVRPVDQGGWDNRTFHLGDEMSVRLPSAERYVAQVEKEHRWLPVLAPRLPLPIPVPLGLGRPGEGYPWPWSVYKWIGGERSGPGTISDLATFAEDLADFLLALWAIDASAGPPAGAHNFHRGGSLHVYDEETRRSVEALAGEVDVPLITEIWERALASRWERKPVWVHGDIAEGNLLVRGGRLSAVIDFGSSGVGDPSSDLVIAWTLLDEPAAQAFRARVALDPQTWERARGWCLWKALITIVEKRHGDIAGADLHRRWIARIVADHLAAR
ncbi:aminoglycoside phosphotransferase family protein [Rhizobium terrae]|uniref:aminoglycoside phosphotransferase family protein n=1 Tax=Rhizobium terrae TaxID=2171756 RepID=UPI000E3DA1F9|nr:aminoglycoside phosphotransferase family protein [Rhizobium terrae]